MQPANRNPLVRFNAPFLLAVSLRSVPVPSSLRRNLAAGGRDLHSNLITEEGPALHSNPIAKEGGQNPPRPGWSSPPFCASWWFVVAIPPLSPFRPHSFSCPRRWNFVTSVTFAVIFRNRKKDQCSCGLLPMLPMLLVKTERRWGTKLRVES